MISVVLLTTRAYSPLADELMLAGFKVTEALWADEILQLLETEHIDVAVVAHDVEDPELPDVQGRVTTVWLKPQATSKDVIWELSQLFPSTSLIQ